MSHPRAMQRYQISYTLPGQSEPTTHLVMACQIATALVYHRPDLAANDEATDVLDRLQAAALNEEPVDQWERSLGITVTHLPL